MILINLIDAAAVKRARHARYMREFTKKNRQLVRDTNRAASQRYRDKHGEVVSVRTKNWKLANVEVVRAYRKKPRALAVEAYNSAKKKGRPWADGQIEIAAKLKAIQDPKCHGCHRLQSEHPYKRSYAVDHCHKTGIVRGLLCDQCNSILGRCSDDPAVLRRLASYLDGKLF